MVWLVGTLVERISLAPCFGLTVPGPSASRLSFLVEVELFALSEAGCIDLRDRGTELVISLRRGIVNTGLEDAG